MKRITFHCKTITPMFLAGVDGRAPELRPSAIKAAMRFWWRAMQSFPTIEALKKEEVKIFGGSYRENGQEKSCRASIDLFVSQPEFTPVIAKEKYRNGNGLEYFFYSMIYFNKGRNAISPGTEFTIRFSTDDANEEILKKGIASLWLLNFFGGIGSRARRGAGNFQVTNITDQDEFLKRIQFNFFPNDDEVLSNFIQQNFTSIKAILVKDPQDPNQNSYSNLLGAELRVSDNEENDWKSALDDIGNRFKEFRLDNNSKSKLKWEQSAAFGLPIKHRHGNYWVKPLMEKIDRRASPLIIRVINFKEKYQWLVVHLNGEFLPPVNSKNENIFRTKQNQNGLADMETINSFMKSLNDSNSITLS